MALLGSTPCGSALLLAWVPPNIASLGFLPNHALGGDVWHNSRKHHCSKRRMSSEVCDFV